MGTTWEPDCPVGLSDLRYLTVTFWGFDRRPHTGELIVHADHALGMVDVFRTLYATRFPSSR
jgi:beta-glucosidase-like glycosyl hydrolase